MNGKKAKAIRRAMQDQNGATKAKEYTPFQRYFIKTTTKSDVTKKKKYIREYLTGKAKKDERAEAWRNLPIIGTLYRIRAIWIISDEPRQRYQAEKKEYKKLPRKQRAGRYQERDRV